MGIVPPITQNALISDLEQEFPGGVRTDTMNRGIYATDASIYQQVPLAIITPRDREDVARALRVANRHDAPVLPRAGGTSLAGQTTGQGSVVIDVSKYMNRLLEVNEAEMWARVEPGLIRDQLNGLLAGKELMFAPETSTSNRANIGGMIGNNSSGMMSIRYGTTIRHTLGATAVLPDGTETWFGTRDEMSSRGIQLLDELMDIVTTHRDLIEARFPKVIRRVGGYSLDAFLNEEPNLAKILVGSEGTLACMVDCKVRLVPKLRNVVAVASHFKTIHEALLAVPFIVAHDPLSAEFMDGPLLRMCLDNPTTSGLMGWYRGRPEAVIPIEFDGATMDESIAKAERLIADMETRGFGYDHVRLYTPADRISIVETRKHGLGVMLKSIGDWKAISFIEDACVPIEHLAEYAEGVIQICTEEQLDIMTYGHASVGVLHLKPVVNLKLPEVRAKCERISRRTMELCKKFHGSWSGEHGDGIARGAQNELFWGDEMMDVFRAVKRMFDPKGIMNPGKIFDTPPVMGPLRYHDGYHKNTHKSMFHFRSDGGLQGAVEMCNGVGACRKIGSGTMCPSYMATREEKDTTRGRANALRLALSGQLGEKAMTSDELYDVLDLCLECKACKTECPSNVDMARMKSEFLHGYHQEHGAGLRERVFAFSPRMSRLNAGPLAKIANAFLGNDSFRLMVNKFLGVATERKLPRYAEEKLQVWFDRQPDPKLPESARDVVLFDDTYTSYHETEIGKWAVRVLTHLGYRVRLARAGCCCRPMISKGFLAEAKQHGLKTLQGLDTYARKGIPIVCIEPSCASSLASDLPDLIDDVDLGERVRKAVMPIEEFLEGEVLAGHIKLELPHAAQRYLLHGHCHQKALNGTGPLHRLMSNGEGKSRVYETDSGCCGMAGSFGYEQEHYDLSQQIGESRLFPAVRNRGEDMPVIANGFSCRHQVKDATGVEPMHFIVALGKAMLGDDIE